MERLTEKRTTPIINKDGLDINYSLVGNYDRCIEKLGQFEDLEEQIGSLFEYNDYDSIFMELSKDKIEMNFCGDAYYGTYTKDELLKLVKQLFGIYLQMEYKKIS